MKALLLGLLPLLTALAGCVEGVDEQAAPAAVQWPALVRLQATGDPARLSLVAAFDETGKTLWFSSTDVEGKANLSVGPDVRRLVLFAGGQSFEIRPDGSHEPTTEVLTPPFALGTRVQFPDHPVPVGVGTTCTEKDDGDLGCGLDEPSIVIDGRNWILYTAACCIGGSSPVFVSKDGGTTFQPVAHPFKDGYGGEGDLAVDAKGNLYYMDIDLATFGIARWNPDLSPAHGYRRPGIPLVDRPWIRATSAGIVHAIYNTGMDTVYYRSVDHALTFEAVPSATFGSALARAYSDTNHKIVGMVGGGHFMESRDDGLTWGDLTPVEGCAGADTAAVDEAGIVWFQGEGCVVGLRNDGSWTGSSYALAPETEHFMTWVAAGGAGAVAVGYYGRVERTAAASVLGMGPQEWFLFVSVSVDAAAQTPHWAALLADPEPVGTGDLGRRLGDFMQLGVGPDGAVHLAYAMNPEMDDSAKASYIGTGPIPAMAPSRSLVGPFKPG